MYLYNSLDNLHNNVFLRTFRIFSQLCETAKIDLFITPNSQFLLAVEMKFVE